MCAPNFPVAEVPLVVAPKRPVTEEDVQKVHAAIEACLKRSMTKAATCATLRRFDVDPQFTSLVWERLELENPEFFLEYNRQLQALESLRGLQLAA